MANFQTVGTLLFTDSNNALPIKIILTVTPSFQLAINFFVNNVDKGTITTNGVDGNALGKAVLEFAGIAKSQGG